MFAYCNHEYLNCDDEFDSTNDLKSYFRDEYFDVLYEPIWEYEYKWGDRWAWNQSDVEIEMKEYARHYFQKKYGQYSVQLFEDPGKTKIMSEQILSDVLYEALIYSIKDCGDPNFYTAINSAIFKAFDKYLELQEWHCGFVDSDETIYRYQEVDVKPVYIEGKLHWISTTFNDEVEPIIWFGSEDDFYDYSELLPICRQNNEWEALCSDYVFSWMDMFVDDYMQYEIVEYGMDVPSLWFAIDTCPIKVDKEGEYNPEDIDKLFFKLYLDNHPAEDLYSKE